MAKKETPSSGKAELTARQITILDFIKTATESQGYAPSMREIGEAAGLNSPASVKYQLDILEEKGLIRRDADRGRAMEVVLPDSMTGEGAHTDKTRFIPLVGAIAAGLGTQAQLRGHLRRGADGAGDALGALGAGAVRAVLRWRARLQGLDPRPLQPRERRVHHRLLLAGRRVRRAHLRVLRGEHAHDPRPRDRRRHGRAHQLPAVPEPAPGDAGLGPADRRAGLPVPAERELRPGRRHPPPRSEDRSSRCANEAIGQVAHPGRDSTDHPAGPRRRRL